MSDRNGQLGRRTFLRTSAALAGVALPTLIPAASLAAPGRRGANDRVNVGIIGLGGRARDIARTCAPISDLQIVAICDCFAPRCGQFMEAVGAGQSWRVYEDFRQMIDKESLDGVMIETTTHARAWITIQAMQAGLDVYIEKPISLTISEGRAMVQAARRYERITQVGTQQRSMPLNNWASDLVKNGALGKIHTVLAPNFVGPDPVPGELGKDDQPLPEGGGAGWWDRWTNQAELRGYDEQLHHGWARWRDFDGGGLCYGVTGWGAHSYDQIQRALGTDATGPVEICLEEPVQRLPAGKFETALGNPDTGVDYRALAKPVVGPRAKVRMRYANGTELRLHLDGDRGPGLGAIFVGEKGKIEINRNKVASNPREILASPDNPGPSQKPETQDHIENWIDGIRTRKPCNADIEIGHRASTVCQLVNIVRDVGRVGEVLRWDPERERFENCDEANEHLSRPRRKGYELGS